MDLNLAKVFIAIYEKGSVSAAAESLFITQPSVSYALKKLRDELGDELFLRGKLGMEATRAAEEIYEDFKKAVLQIESVVEGRKAFSYKDSHQTFRIAMSDLGEYFYLPAIYKKIASEAPNISLEAVPLNSAKMQEWLDKGFIDIALCNRTYDVNNVYCHVIRKERYVCLASKDHPRLKNQLNLQALLEEKHVVVSAQAGHKSFENWMAKHGLDFRTRLRTPHFSVIGSLIEGTDSIAVVPETIADMHIKSGSLVSYELPFQLPGIEVCLYSKKSMREKKSHEWLIRQVISACSEKEK
ncbi:LysR family transcriptional regulator [Franconibacter daqui]|uniref:LysR family transcriptional regulator n=1 Tax=Franconibacter daqui TaxID=2047724 RepID=UPI0030CFDC60